MPADAKARCRVDAPDLARRRLLDVFSDRGSASPASNSAAIVEPAADAKGGNPPQNYLLDVQQISRKPAKGQDDLDLPPTSSAASSNRSRRKARATVTASPQPCFENDQIVADVGDPGMTRTCDLRFRKPSLYPAELRDRGPA
jgi:hypothetical protein